MKRNDEIMSQEEYWELVGYINGRDIADLPLALEGYFPESVTIAQLSKLMTDISKHTGMSVKLQAQVCSDCNKLHLFLIMEHPEIEDEEWLFEEENDNDE